MRDHLAWPLRRGIAVAVMQRGPSLLLRLVSRLVDSALNCSSKNGSYKHTPIARRKAMNLVVSLMIANYQKDPMLVNRRWPRMEPPCVEGPLGEKYRFSHGRMKHVCGHRVCRRKELAERHGHHCTLYPIHCVRPVANSGGP